MDIVLPEVTKYKIGVGRRIISYFWLIATFTIFILLIVGIFDLDYEKSALPLVLLIPGLAITGFALYAFSDDAKGVLTIGADRLTYQSLLRRRVVLLSEVGGYRAYRGGNRSSNGKVIIIFPKDKNQGEIAMSQYIQPQPVLLKWLSTHFPNTDILEHMQDEKNILENPEFGATREERQERLALATKVAIATNVIGCLAGVSLFIFSKTPPALLFGAIVYVPLSFLVAPWSKRLIFFNNKTNSAHPWIALGLIICSIALMARALFSYSLSDYAQQSLWLSVFLLSIAMTVLMLMSTNEFNKRTSLDIGNVMAFWLFYFLFSLGAYIITNCELDQSPTQTLTTTVTDKRVSHGKNSTDYYLKIKPVAPVNEDEIHVSEEFFSTKEAGNEITLYARQGRWGTPWYYFNEDE